MFSKMWPQLSKPWYFNNPFGVTADAEGNVYIADFSNQRVQKFDADGNYITSWVGRQTMKLQFPCSVAVDSDKNVYVLEFGAFRVQKFDSIGKFITVWGSEGSGDGQLTSPRGVVADASGYIYVLDNAGRVQKFTANGNFVVAWRRTVFQSRSHRD
jgi:tripartite motif-containing protein 71